eukprot:2674945-Rhodomonas_salina.1
MLRAACYSYSPTAITLLGVSYSGYYSTVSGDAPTTTTTTTILLRYDTTRVLLMSVMVLPASFTLLWAALFVSVAIALAAGAKSNTFPRLAGAHCTGIALIWL